MLPDFAGPILLFVALAAAAALAIRIARRCCADHLEQRVAAVMLTVALPVLVVLSLDTLRLLWGPQLTHLPAVTAVLVLLALVTPNGRSRTQPPQKTPPAATNDNRPHRRPWRRGGLTLLLPVVAAYTVVAALSALQPPHAYDGLYYRLPMIVRWIRADGLHVVPDVYELGIAGNADVWLWLFASSASEGLTRLALTPIALLLGVTVYALARQLRATRAASLTACAIALATPICLHQTFSAYSDLFGAAFFVTALYWSLRIAQSTQPHAQCVRAALAGLAFGVALGAKLTMLYFALPPLLLLLWVSWHGTRNPRSVATIFIAFALCAAPGFLFWPARNLIETGWPLYPVMLPWGDGWIGRGQPLGYLPGIAPQSPWLMPLYPWFEWKASGYPLSVDAGLGPAFASLIVPAMIAALLALRTRVFAPRRIPWVGVACVVLLSILVWLGPLRAYVRYGLPVWIVCVVLAAPALGWLRRRAASGFTPFATALVCLGCAAAVWPLAKHAKYLWIDAQGSRDVYYGLPPKYDALPAGSVVLNGAHELYNYPLLGSRWQYHVIESMTAAANAIEVPPSRRHVQRHNIAYVCTHQTLPALSPDGVRFTPVAEPSQQPTFITPDAPRIYRVELQPTSNNTTITNAADATASSASRQSPSSQDQSRQ